MYCLDVAVYAIEASDIAKQTQAIVDENKMTYRIEVVHNTVEVCYTLYFAFVSYCKTYLSLGTGSKIC
jgi:hypothetical protein